MLDHHLMPYVAALGCGVGLIVVLWILGRSKRPSALERHLVFGWVYLRMAICFACAAACLGGWFYMALRMRGLNGRALVPLDLLWIALCLVPMAVWFVRVGLYGKTSKSSSLAHDRDVQPRRLERYGRYE